MVSISYRKIVLESEAFADAHYQINSFGNGDLWEVVEHNKLQDFNYPLLWLQDGNSSTNETELTYTFNVIALDQVLNGEENENFVKSSMYQILLDYLAYFDNAVLYDIDGERIAFKISKNTNSTSFTERYDDILTGWNMSVTFRTPLRFNACNIPKD